MAVTSSGQVVASIENANAGPTYSVTHLADALETLGCQSTVYCVGTPCAQVTTVRVQAFEPARWRMMRRVGMAPPMATALLRSEHAVLHSHGLWSLPGHYASQACRAGHSRSVISPRGMLSDWALEHHRWRKLPVWLMWQRQDLQDASGLHATSGAEAMDCRRVGLRAPIAIIPNGVSVPEVGNVLGRRNQIVFLSRLHKKKGLDLLVRAWAKLEQDLPAWSLTVAGPDEDGSGCRAKDLAKALNCHRVEFLGPVHGEGKRRLLSEAALFVLPSQSENFGLAVAEAMAHGLPVITTKGTPWQALEKNGAGWWITLTVDELANAISKAAQMPSCELDAMGARGRAWMSAEYAWKSVGESMLAFYRWLIEGEVRPGFVHLD